VPFSWISRGLKTGTTVLARASSNVPDHQVQVAANGDKCGTYSEGPTTSLVHDVASFANINDLATKNNLVMGYDGHQREFAGEDLKQFILFCSIIFCDIPYVLLFLIFLGTEQELCLSHCNKLLLS
jgi:hypothetical protein